MRGRCLQRRHSAAQFKITEVTVCWSERNQGDRFIDSVECITSTHRRIRLCRIPLVKLKEVTPVSIACRDNTLDTRFVMTVACSQHTNAQSTAYAQRAIYLQLDWRVLFKRQRVRIKTKRPGGKTGSGGIRTHAPAETGALNQRLGPLGHATTKFPPEHKHQVQSPQLS